MKHILSLGAGVQSSTLALMAAHGEITPMPDAAVFADTQAEPESVYKWLEWLEKQLPFPVYRVTTGSIERDTLGALEEKKIASSRFYDCAVKTHERGANGFSITVPLYTLNNKKEGQLRRQCTSEYKILPVRKWSRSFVGLKPRQRSREKLMVKWIGISTDEAHRAKLKPDAWEDIRYPLLELGMSRQDCLVWFARKGYPLPSKSSCYFCPYHDDALWRDMKMNDPMTFDRAVAFDKAVRNKTARGVLAPVFLHRSLKPLDEIDFRNLEDAGQERLFGGDPLDEKGFAVECEGMCGV